MARHEFTPTSNDAGYTRWDLPASVWSGAEYGEDSIRLVHDRAADDWYGCTEADQCDRRDLSDEDIASIRAEFRLA